MPQCQGLNFANKVFDCRPAGLPIGLQLVGQAWKEADLFFAASAIESRVRAMGRQKLPKMCYDILHDSQLPA